MKIEELIAKIEFEIDELTPGTLRPETNLKDTDIWTSMHALILIALIDTEYDVTINGEDLRQINSIQDIYNIIKSRKAN